ncbi:MAG TPA: hypothetical protein VIL01_00580 [Thermomicrobiales bacterium]
MKRIIFTVACLVLVAVSIALSTGADAASAGGMMSIQSSYWCRNC